jgi:hypothetical protein
MHHGESEGCASAIHGRKGSYVRVRSGTHEHTGFKLPVSSTVKIPIHFMLEIRVMNTYYLEGGMLRQNLQTQTDLLVNLHTTHPQCSGGRYQLTLVHHHRPKPCVSKAVCMMKGAVTITLRVSIGTLLPRLGPPRSLSVQTAGSAPAGRRARSYPEPSASSRLPARPAQSMSRCKPYSRSTPG